MRSRAYRIAFERGGLVVLAALALYLWLAPTVFVTGDNAELAAIGARGGVPHPSGYPLFILWLRVMQWLPGATPAHVAALATALLAAAVLLVLHAACRAWGATPTAATLTIAIYAAAPMVLRLSTEGDVFTLNNLAAVTVLWLAAARGPLDGARRATALALVAGLGLSNHMSCALLAPIGILGVIRGMREATLPKPAVLALAITALVVGLTPYLYLLVPPHSGLTWGNIDGAHALVHHALRMDYGGPFAAAADGDHVTLGEGLGAMFAVFARTWLWAPLLLGLATLVTLVAAPARALARISDDAGDDAAREPRWGWGMLAASWLLAGPWVLGRLNVAPVGVGAYVCERFDLLPAMLLALPIAAAFTIVGARVVAAVRSELVRSLPVITVVALVGAAAAAALSIAHLAGIHSPATERGVANILESLPPNAVMITVSDEIDFGTDYLQEALHDRVDVISVAWSLMGGPWYRDRIARKGLTMSAAHGEPASVAFAEQVLAEGHPLFIDSYAGKIAAALPVYPYGVLFRVLPRGSTPPTLDEVAAINRTVFEHYNLAYPTPGPDDGFATDMHRMYAGVWLRLADGFAARHELDKAAWAQQLARQLAPTAE